MSSRVARRCAFWLVLVSLGLQIGSAVPLGLTEPLSDAVGALVRLFRTHCVPLAHGRLVPPRPPLTPVGTLDGDQVWAHPETGMAVVIRADPPECTVTDALNVLPVGRGHELDRAAERVVRDSLPRFLAFEPEAFALVARGWAPDGRPEDHPTFVLYHRDRPGPGRGAATLRLVAPVSPDLSGRIAALGSGG